MYKKDMNIESYDGQDAFYTGTDEEYEEFLKNADVKMNDVEEAEPVANTQRINLNETINIQGVIDKFRKTAGGIENSAKKIKDSVVSKMDIFKTKKEENDEAFSAETEDGAEEEGIANKIKSTVKSSAEKIDEFREGVELIPELSDKFSDTNVKMERICSEVSNLSKKLDELNDKLHAMEQSDKSNSGKQQDFRDEMTKVIETVSAGISEIKQSVNSVSKLNDSVFDLKNTQLNTKNAVSDLEINFKRLKKKCVLGVTVLSILSAIVIVLEIVLMLS